MARLGALCGRLFVGHMVRLYSLRFAGWCVKIHLYADILAAAPERLRSPPWRQDSAREAVPLAFPWMVSFILADEIPCGLKSLPPSDQFELNLPFPAIFIEAVNAPVFSIKHDSGIINIYGVGVVEVEKHYAFFFAGSFEVGPTEVFFWGETLSREGWEERDSSSAKALLALVTHDWLTYLFDFLREKKAHLGESLGGRVRLATEGREWHKIKKVVHVRLSQADHKSTEIGYPIDWKHSWEVMGHWRKVPGIGKTRNGEYTMKGVTWVRPFVKGHGPLIKKTRFVEGNP